jgi:hypothetical protein
MDSENHCTDCCCAKSWTALGITEYTGKSIPEHIIALRVEMEALKIENSTLLEKLHAAERERDEADRRAGSAERREKSTSQTLCSLTSWRDEQKDQAGYDRSVSFDVVWAETLAKAKERDTLEAAHTRG